MEGFGGAGVLTILPRPVTGLGEAAPERGARNAEGLRGRLEPVALVEHGESGTEIHLNARPAAVLSGGLGTTDTSDDPLADDLPLEGGERSDDGGEQASARRGGVQAVIAQGHEFDALLTELVQDLQNVPEGPTEPVEFPTGDDIDPPSLTGTEHLLELWAVGLGTGESFIDEGIVDLPASHSGRLAEFIKL